MGKRNVEEERVIKEVKAQNFLNLFSLDNLSLSSISKNIGHIITIISKALKERKVEAQELTPLRVFLRATVERVEFKFTKYNELRIKPLGQYVNAIIRYINSKSLHSIHALPEAKTNAQKLACELLLPEQSIEAPSTAPLQTDPSQPDPVEVAKVQAHQQFLTHKTKSATFLRFVNDKAKLALEQKAAPPSVFYKATVEGERNKSYKTFFNTLYPDSPITGDKRKAETIEQITKTSQTTKRVKPTTTFSAR